MHMPYGPPFSPPSAQRRYTGRHMQAATRKPFWRVDGGAFFLHTKLAAAALCSLDGGPPSDKSWREVKKEKRSLWEAHFPIGIFVPRVQLPLATMGFSLAYTSNKSPVSSVNSALHLLGPMVAVGLNSL